MKCSRAVIDGLAWTDVTSSSIRRIVWVRSGDEGAARADAVENDDDEALGSLFVEFQQGKTYHYADATEQDARDVIEAPSAGKALNALIKRTYDHEPVEIEEE